MRMFFSLPGSVSAYPHRREIGRGLTVRKELRLDQARVSLDLVHDGYDACLLDDLLEKLDGEVADTDRADLLGLLLQADELCPCLGYTGGVPVDRLLAIISERVEVLAG